MSHDFVKQWMQFRCAGWCGESYELARGVVVLRGAIAAIVCGPCLARVIVEVAAPIGSGVSESVS